MTVSKEQIINGEQALEAYLEHLRSQWQKHRYLRISVKTGKQRTSTQNAALHLYCTQLAEALNDAGLDMVTVLSPGTEIPWTEHSIKSEMWKKVQKAMTGHESTTKPKTTEYGPIYDTISRYISQTFGVFVPWPSKDRD